MLPTVNLDVYCTVWMAEEEEGKVQRGIPLPHLEGAEVRTMAGVLMPSEDVEIMLGAVGGGTGVEDLQGDSGIDILKLWHDVSAIQ